MSLDKAIKHGKEKRKPYRGGKAVDPSCRNHKGCDWCEGNRKYANKKRENSARDKLREELSQIVLNHTKNCMPGCKGMDCGM